MNALIMMIKLYPTLQLPQNSIIMIRASIFKDADYVDYVHFSALIT